METGKKKILKNLVIGLAACFLALVGWQIFILHLLDEDKISTFFATIAVVGNLSMMVQSILLSISSSP